MNTRPLLLLLAYCVSQAASALDITLPRETAAYAPSDLPGFKLVQQNCLMCHSAHYVLYQPPDSARAYWDGIVRKMKHPYGAFFADEDIAPMVDYLVKIYGAEQAGARATPP